MGHFTKLCILLNCVSFELFLHKTFMRIMEMHIKSLIFLCSDLKTKVQNLLNINITDIKTRSLANRIFQFLLH